MMVTQEKLKELLHYDPDTGWFTWRVEVQCYGGGRKPGDRAGSQNAAGYRHIGLKGKPPYKEHRLAWLYAYGVWPPTEIDHANRDPSDNRLTNLRLASRSQNSANMVKPVGASGHKGVYKNKGTQRWFAQISVDCKSKYLGSFDSPEEAYTAYVAAAREHYGEFARIA